MIDNTLLAIMNLIIGVCYFSIALAVFVAPLSIRWMRRLGTAGAGFALSLIIFFVGCGMHHFDMFIHYVSREPIINTETYTHFFIWDAMQIVGAATALLFLVFRGKRFIEVLREG